MRFAIPFTIAHDPRLARQAVRRLAELVDLINMDKEEQAIDPEEYTGNMKDYPRWMENTFSNASLVEALRVACELDAEDMEGWDLLTWYEELTSNLTFNYELRAPGGVKLDVKAIQASDDEHAPPPEPGTWQLAFEADDEHYGGDMVHLWLLMACGAESIGEAVMEEGATEIPDDDII